MLSGVPDLDQRGRLRINLTQREFEVEGSEEFVRSFADRIQELLRPAGRTAAAASGPPAREPSGRRPAARPISAASASSCCACRPRATDVDKMLAAGFYVQASSADDAFATADANRRLTEQGIKLGNPSQCVKQSLLAKRVFLVSKGRYRVSQPGRAHLRQLLGPGRGGLTGPTRRRTIQHRHHGPDTDPGDPN